MLVPGTCTRSIFGVDFEILPHKTTTTRRRKHRFHQCLSADDRRFCAYMVVLSHTTPHRRRCSILRLLIAVVVAYGRRHPWPQSVLTRLVFIYIYLVYMNLLFFPCYDVVYNVEPHSSSSFADRGKLPCLAWRAIFHYACDDPLTTFF